jgi:arginyl-tRNA synthetase
MKEILHQLLVSALAANGVADASVTIEHPAELAHGDYASGAALQYAKQVGMNPRALAEKIVAALGTIDGVDKIEIAGPGFINFTLDRAAIARSIEAARTTDMWGAIAKEQGKKIMVEYTDPNPFKEFHIGHLMSNAIGESISRLLQFSGATVRRANYQGDVGPHVAKCIWGLKKLGLSATSSAALGEAYAAGAKAYEEDEAAKREIDEINKKVYEHTDSEVDALYTEGRATSLAHFEDLYRLLGTTFDHYFFESASAPKGIALVEAHPGVFEQSDGATVFKGEKAGLHTRVFLTSKGLPTYEAKDLGLLALKQDVGALDESITVTANEQADYFKVMLAAAKELPEVRDIANKTKHITHGMMRFAEGKMSSRTGNVITGESLIEELRTVASERAQESRADDKAALADAVAVAGIKFQILRQSTNKDIVFDRERALSLEGDSGPYLQYAHARAHQIVERAQSEGGIGALRSGTMIYHSEKSDAVIRLVARFPDIIEYAAEKLEPHILATYLIALASAFNSWYAQEQILDGTEQAARKAAIVDAVRKTLKNGLWVLGIPAPEKM